MTMITPSSKLTLTKGNKSWYLARLGLPFFSARRVTQLGHNVVFVKRRFYDVFKV